jgi:GNAT superfamily N-acetyltransferase
VPFRVADLDASTLGDALDLCVPAGTRAQHVEAQRRESEAWLGEILQEWSPCGKVSYVDDRVAGLLLYLPAALFTGSSLCRAYQDNPVELPAAWTDRNVVAVVCLWVLTLRQGMGGALLRALLEELEQGRAFRGRPCREVGVMVYAPSEGTHWPAGPAAFYESFGFHAEQSDLRTNRVWLTRAWPGCCGAA